jgi:hypothetical protein
MATETKKIKKDVNIQYMRDKDAQKVKGIFRFHERKGGTLDFSYKFYKGDPIEDYHLTDDQVYEIPLGVAKHLNRSGRYPIHEFTQTEDGKPRQDIGKRVARYSFESLEFMDINDMKDVTDTIPEITSAG